MLCPDAPGPVFRWYGWIGEKSPPYMAVDIRMMHHFLMSHCQRVWWEQVPTLAKES